jgi:signal transduction histidine kinase
VGAGVALSDLSMSASEGVGKDAITTGEPVLIEDGAAEDLRVTNRAIRALGIRSLMVTPLIVGGTAVGILEVGAGRAGSIRAPIGCCGSWPDRVADRARARPPGRAKRATSRTSCGGSAKAWSVADHRQSCQLRQRRVRRHGRRRVGCAAWPAVDGVPRGAQDIEALTERMRQPSFHGEVLLITKSGEPRPVLVSLATVAREGGRAERIGVFRDISREHELRFRVIREQKFRTLGSLAAGVAHNINNRLTPVLGWTEMLLERPRGRRDAGSRRARPRAHRDQPGRVRQCRHGPRLQEYARPGRVKGPEAVQLRDVLEHLLALTRPQWDNEAARRGIRYEIDLKIEPAPAILAVASEIREAILNILENALAAMSRGGRLTLHVRGVDSLAILSISDTGKGMSDEVKRLAFEPFFTTRAGEGGSGLGLALAQEIVQRYGGTISLESQEGVGTTFTLSFPAITAEPSGASVFLPSIEPLRVLAVEDEPEVLDLVRAMLTYAGHTVTTAASGREALDLFQRETIDVVVTDLGMPGMTGLVLADELKRQRAVPVILLTGWADELDPIADAQRRRRCREAAHPRSAPRGSRARCPGARASRLARPRQGACAGRRRCGGRRALSPLIARCPVLRSICPSPVGCPLRDGGAGTGDPGPPTPTPPPPAHAPPRERAPEMHTPERTARDRRASSLVERRRRRRGCGEGQSPTERRRSLSDDGGRHRTRAGPESGWASSLVERRRRAAPDAGRARVR